MESCPVCVRTRDLFVWLVRLLLVRTQLDGHVLLRLDEV
jgi:hypothetical protein